MTSATETISSPSSWRGGTCRAEVSHLLNCVDDEAHAGSSLSFQLSSGVWASGFTVTEGPRRSLTLDENRFAAPVQKEEVVEFLNHSSPKPCSKGLERMWGLCREGIKSPLDIEVGRAGRLRRPQTPASCGQTAGRLHL